MNEIIRVTKEIERLEANRKKIIDFTFKEKEKEINKLKKENQKLEEENRNLKSVIQQLEAKVRQLNS